MFTFNSLLYAAFGFGIALTLVGVVGLLTFVRNLDKRIERLESKQSTKNAVVDTTEEFMPKLIEVIRQYQVLGAHLDNLEMKAAYMRNVGNPDASWSEIVKWFNDKYPTKPHAKGRAE